MKVRKNMKKFRLTLYASDLLLEARKKEERGKEGKKGKREERGQEETIII